MAALCVPCCGSRVAIVLRGPSPRSALVAGLAVVAAFTGDATTARGDSSHDVASAFFVAKSENKNQVHYGVHLDATCSPSGAAPVFAYWRMLEHGPGATEPLLSREQPAYGIADQRVVDRRADGGRLVVRLRALADRPIEIVTGPRDGGCEVTATTVIDGAPATLSSVYAQLRWPFGVDYLMLSGRSLTDGRLLRERLAK
jgi:hypothetical protein